MAKKLDKTQHYDATSEQVWDMLLNTDFVKAKLHAAGATDASAETMREGDATTLVCRRVLPADLPSFVRKFTGDELTLIETQRWQDPDGDTRSADFIVDFGDQPISLKGKIKIEPDGDGTKVHTTGQVKCTVPFAGGKIESVAVEWTEKYLDKENQVGTEWLSDD